MVKALVGVDLQPQNSYQLANLPYAIQTYIHISYCKFPPSVTPVVSWLQATNGFPTTRPPPTQRQQYVYCNWRQTRSCEFSKQKLKYFISCPSIAELSCHNGKMPFCNSIFQSQRETVKCSNGNVFLSAWGTVKDVRFSVRRM